MSIQAFNQALELIHRGNLTQAEALLRTALRRDPKQPELNDMLGTVLVKLDKLEQARYFHEAALRGAPERSEFWNNYGGLLLAEGRFADAKGAFERVLTINPREVMGYWGLARACAQMRDFSGMIGAARRGAEVDPDRPEFWVNVAIGYLAAGQPREAKEMIARAAMADPMRVGPQYLSTLLYHPEMEPAAVLADHASWGNLLARMVPERPRQWWRDAGAGRPGGRALRVGYLSSDLRRHSVAYFMEPLLEAHDPARVEVFVYHAASNDEVSARMQKRARKWTNIGALNDEQVVAAIVGDRIDVLVELNGMTIGGRPGVLAMRAAPVQVSYAGYACASGIPTVDARIVDAITDPLRHGDEVLDLGAAAKLGRDGLVRLDRCFLCYRADPDAPAVGTLPALSAGRVTFGSFSLMGKINDRVLASWVRILRRVPGSRLMMKNSGLTDPAVRERVRTAFSAMSVEEDRVELIAWSEKLEDHLSRYNRIDVALDTFPYNGTTTTCEAMWMGVPTVTLRGDRHVARVGESLAHAVGLDELVGADEASYERIAAELATDLPRLAAMRAGLRERMRTSSLGDATAHARAMESAYAGLWQAWCDGRLRA